MLMNQIKTITWYKKILFTPQVGKKHIKCAHTHMYTLFPKEDTKSGKYKSKDWQNWLPQNKNLIWDKSSIIKIKIHDRIK